MNKRQFNSLVMYKAVQALFSSATEVWKDVVSVADIYQQFSETITTIEKRGLTQQERATMGYTADKNQKLEAAVRLAYNLVLKLRAYAKITQDTVLKQDIDFSISDLMQGPQLQMISRLRFVHDKGQQYQAQASAYQVTNQLLSELQTTINELKTLGGQCGIVGDQRAVATADLEELFAKARHQLDALDDLVKGLVMDNTFIASYLQARKTTDQRSSATTETNSI